MWEREGNGVERRKRGEERKSKKEKKKFSLVGWGG